MKLHQQAKLNHLSFPTANVADTAAFFEKYLGCEVIATGQHCLLKRNGFDIVLEQVDKEVPVWPKNFHFGLEVNTLEDVQTLYREFLEGGVQMETEVFNNTRGSRFFCRAPGGVLIEINTRADMDQDQWRALFQQKTQ
ncbi:catechol 2,3-dioxygenase-like lactoylglutathione lyase family enzyme [Caballeronia udeis]|jgi:catechol 2,3-dioxygenase-like lactoylglutathione lyase family enzyme|uniref:Catechol 2,3-dioxygenase-like lactoylglutathione lyase family enzyme n=1 Tax=Caballeronia udeis TaxID=1232866 RepID=A0ABW8MFA5_9BURK